MEQLPRAVGMAPSCWSSGSVETLLSDTGLGFWAMLCLDSMSLVGLFSWGYSVIP